MYTAETVLAAVAVIPSSADIGCRIRPKDMAT